MITARREEEVQRGENDWKKEENMVIKGIWQKLQYRNN
jgi:hypothetical protein